MPAPLPPRPEPTTRHAILVAVQTPGVAAAALDRSLDELRRLAEGLGIEVLDTVVQRRDSARRSHLFGKGKFDALAARFAVDPDTPPPEGGPPRPTVLIVDNELTPGQQALLEKTVEAEVLDRTAVILEVFETRARTAIARLELEIARLEYALPRMRDLDEPDREGGGGRGERGHTQAELRRQQIRRRIPVLRGQIESARAADDMARERRAGMPVAAIVGYTNAGKSSLMRALTGEPVYVADKLFATLGSTVRAITPETDPKALVVDTVGFIEDLPTALVASFRSTLEEVREADLLVFVVDASDAHRAEQLAVTRRTVAELAAEGQGAEVRALAPEMLVFNKVDRLDPEARAALRDAWPDALQVSAFDPADVARLRSAIEQHMRRGHQRVWLRVPFSAGRLVGEVHEAARVVRESYDEVGTVLEVDIAQAELGRLLKRGAERVEAPEG